MPTTPAWLDRTMYPFPSRFASLHAGRMHYVDEGHGDPILFVHGTPTWSFEYRHLIRALAPAHRCVAPDHFGFGLSERPGQFAYSPEAHAAALSEFVDQAGLDGYTLVVHDFGGPIGLPLALASQSRVARIVLMNTWMWPFDDDPEMLKRARIAGSAFGAWMYRHLNFSLKVLMPGAYGSRARLTPDVHRQYLEVFRDKDARVQVLHALARALTGSRDHYAALWAEAARLRRVPSLIVWGLKDTAFKPSQLARWREALPAAEVVILEEAGHWPHEEEPQAVIDAMQRFLDPAPLTGRP